MTGELLSKKTRQEFREYFARHTLRQIEMAFDGADITCVNDFDPPVSGERRRLVEHYYHSIDFTRWSDVCKVLQVYENVLADLEQAASNGGTWAEHAQASFAALRRWLTKDGYTYNDGRLTRSAGDVDLAEVGRIASRLDAPELQRQIDRMRAAAQEDPALAIGTAKELLETTCKTILEANQVEIAPEWDLPRLLKEARETLGLLPAQMPLEVRGAEIIRKLLGNLGTLGHSLAELRNLYGTGHGKHGKAKGLEPRHARLAVGAAATLATFLFETHQARPKSDTAAT